MNEQGIIFPRNNVKFAKTILMVFIVCIFSFTPAHIIAQTPTPDPDEFAPIWGSEVSVAEWTPDSRKFIFFSGGWAKFTSDWNVFDTQTRQLSEQNTWPLRSNLASAEIQAFGLTKAVYKIQEPLYFLAPDGNTLVFARQVDCGEQACLYHLILADRRTKEIFDTNTDVFFPFTLNAFRVIWNHSGTAFVLMQTDGFAGDRAFLTTYVTGYTQGVVHTQTTNSVASPQLNGNSYRSIDAFQFSSDDKMLLISAINLSNDQIALINYNLNNPTQSIVVPSQFASTAVAAGLAPNSQTRILMFNAKGLMQYDMANGQVIVLNDKLDTTQTVRAAWFSPNGEWFAYQEKGRALYVVRLATQSEGLFTPTTTVNPTRASTPTPVSISTQ